MLSSPLETCLSRLCTSTSRTSTASEARFSYLAEEQQLPAIHADAIVSVLLDEARTLPNVVWVDLDGTLINYRRRGLGDSMVLQGRTVGLMQACADHGIPLGIYSYWFEDDICWFLKDRPHIKELIQHSPGGIPLVRGREYIADAAFARDMPQHDVYCIIDQEWPRFIHASDQDGIYARAPKFMEGNELLLDDEPPEKAYDSISQHLARFIEDWHTTSLADALATSTHRFMHVERVENPHAIHFLTNAELYRFTRIIEHLSTT